MSEITTAPEVYAKLDEINKQVKIILKEREDLINQVYAYRGKLKEARESIEKQTIVIAYQSTDIDTLKAALLRSIGDTRVCPHCIQLFIPNDTTTEEALETIRGCI